MKPVLITRRDLARDAGRRWRRTFCNGKRWRDDLAKSIADRLDELTDPTPDEVNAIIGNDSWTELTCDGCERQVDAVVHVGEDPDGYSPDTCTSSLCEACVREALAAFTKEPAS